MVKVNGGRRTKKIVKFLRNKLSNQEVRKVLVKIDVPITENSSEEEIVEALLKSYDKILPFLSSYEKLS